MTVSSRLLVLCLLFDISELVSSISPPPPRLSYDAISLLLIKDSVFIDLSSELLSNWNTSKDYYHWYVVTCNSVSRRVTSLNITGTTDFLSIESRYNITIRGSVLDEKLSPTVGSLTELRFLSLPHNAFYGEIPVEIEKLRDLEVLELQENNFSGLIPDQLSNIFNLRVINLGYNFFTDLIPEKLIGFGRISVIDLSYNQLNGGIRIDHFSRCQSLVHLKFSRN